MAPFGKHVVEDDRLIPGPTAPAASARRSRGRSRSRWWGGEVWAVGRAAKRAGPAMGLGAAAWPVGAAGSQRSWATSMRGEILADVEQ